MVDTHDRFLYLVVPEGKPVRDGVSIGRQAGFTWSGRGTIQVMREWPRRAPPAETMEWQPELEQRAKLTHRVLDTQAAHKNVLVLEFRCPHPKVRACLASPLSTFEPEPSFLEVKEHSNTALRGGRGVGVVGKNLSGGGDTALTLPLT